MTIPATTRKAGPFTGNGSTTAFPFTFKVFTTADIAVIKADVDGIESALTLDSDYSVTLNSDQDATPGGTVTYPISGSPLPSTDKLSIKGDVDYEQGTDIPTGGDFNPVVLENALDSLSMQIQQVQEAVSRAAVVPITSAADAADLVADIALLASKIDNLDTIFANMADITTVADDLNEAVSEIETVSGSITNVNNVGNNITNVNTVAGISANVTTVAGISANVTTVAGISAAVSGVAAISAAVSAVNSNATNINAVNSNATNINAVAANETNIDAVAANETNIDAVVANETNIDAVAANATNINAVAGNETNIDAVAANEANIDTVAGINADVTTVAGISSAVSAVAADATDIGTVSANIADVNAVADSIADVNTAADNIAAIIAAPTEATNAANSAIAAAASAAAAATSLDSFDDRYLGSKTSDPTLDNDGNALVTGALYYSSTEQAMKVYDGAAWILASSAGAASMNAFKFVATAGQTTFSGAATVGGTLSYTSGNIIVFMNGSALDAADYTATDGTSIVLGAAAALNDELVIVAFESFTVADTYSRTAADAKFLDKTNITAGKVLGRNTSGSGAVQELPIAVDSSGNVILGGASQLQSAALTVYGPVAARNGGVDGTYQPAFIAQYSGNSSEANAITTAVSSAAGGSGFRFDVSNGGGSASRTTSVEITRTDFKFNSGYGSAVTAYGCRAWVSANAAGTILGAGNVSSVTKNTTAVFTVNFSNAMPDTNYGAQGFCRSVGGVPDWWLSATSTQTKTTSAFQVTTRYPGGQGDPTDFSISFVR